MLFLFLLAFLQIFVFVFGQIVGTAVHIRLNTASLLFVTELVRTLVRLW